MVRRSLKVACLTALCAAAFVAIPSADEPRGPFQHVLLISIDGLHASDLDWYLADPPVGSALADLSAHGRTYTNASATKPSDSFPGMLAMVTGGTPRSTGVYYDDGWDRTLAGATGACTPGTRARWKQNLDLTPTSFASFEAYVTFWSGFVGTSLDATKLPRDPASADCLARVFPHQFPRVNNVFELIKAAGGRTAWADKHPAYEFLMGLAGNGVDDLYTPEIATSISPAPPAPLTAVITDSFSRTMDYDDMKVRAIVNEIRGLDHTGTAAPGVPTLFGMNFQAVSVAQKLDMSLVGGEKGGYLDANGTPSGPLQRALRHTDESIASMLAALDQEGLLESTLVIVSAKHGNSPIDPSKLSRLGTAGITGIVNGIAPGLALLSADTGPLIWLNDSTKAEAVATALKAASASVTGIDAGAPGGGVLWGADLAAQFGSSASDARVPDLILFPIPGTVYGAGPTKIADHGSFYPDDVHVALLMSNPRLPAMTIDEPVETRQIACTILRSLGMDCDALTSQQTEPSMCLPPMGWAFGHGQ
jgi:Type I phosphodiesterase / nucleotide pyrophosphatase